MTRLLLVSVAALAACAAPAPDAAPADVAALEAEVRAESQALVDALNAHDADAILDFYQLDDAFTQVACVEVRRGGSGFAALTRAFHAQFDDAVYAMNIQDVRILGSDAAVVTLQGTLLAPLFVSRTLRRGDDGRWRVVHEHESWPDCPAPPAPHPGTAPGEDEPIG